MVVLSSALRKRGLRKVTIAAWPRRSMVAVASSILPLVREFVEPRQRFRPRQQHRMTKVSAGCRISEHMREKDAVVDLEPALRLLLERVLGGERRRLTARGPVRRVPHHVPAVRRE